VVPRHAIQSHFAAGSFPFAYSFRMMVCVCVALCFPVRDCRSDNSNIPGSRVVFRLRQMRPFLATFVKSRDEPGIQTAGNKLGVADDLAEKRKRRMDAAHGIFIESAS